MDSAINKLRIISLKVPDVSQASGLQAAASVMTTLTSTVFEAQINPEQISRNFSIKLRKLPRDRWLWIDSGMRLPVE